MTEKQRFAAALRREPVEGHVPTFELVFYLTMEAFGKVHPLHRSFSQWKQMSDKERELQRIDVADIYIAIAKNMVTAAFFIRNLGLSLTKIFALWN